MRKRRKDAPAAEPPRPKKRSETDRVAWLQGLHVIWQWKRQQEGKRDGI
ncbi:MAG: hypothetical protein FWD79_05610 [Desulfobulbus sp.]|nr:hypothetical protein [Desulfobulbus sp.]